MTESKLERNFWRYWLSGLLLLAAMIAMNPWLATDIAPGGIGDHQAAATAARVNAIQQSWQAAGALYLARVGMAIDLIFIGVYAFGAYCGGRLFARNSKPALARLGWVIAVCAIVFALTDYAETIAQFIQLMRLEGDDALAGLAATVRPVKIVVFLVTLIGILVALFIRRTARGSA